MLRPLKRRKITKSRNRFIKRIIILTSLFLIIFNIFIISYGEELTAEEIISKMNKLMNQDTVEAKVKMTIITTSGEERVFSYDSYSKNKGEKNLIRYILGCISPVQSEYANLLQIPKVKKWKVVISLMKTPGQAILLLKISAVKNLAPK
jgi:hypothetical protein